MLLMIGILMIAAALWLFLVFPNPSCRKRMEKWKKARFAHRGLHDASKGIVENTIPAFEAACASGVGIELDLRFTKDMRAVVFHDDSLLRLTGKRLSVGEVTLSELQAMPLAGVRDARVPTLQQALDAVKGRVPLLIELKSEKAYARLCRALTEQLRLYPGAYLVESFDPRILRWFRKNAPEVPRGQLVCAPAGYARRAPYPARLAMANLLANAASRPDFIAYDVSAFRFPALRVQRALFKTPMAAWTVDSMPAAALVEAREDMCIFEKIVP